MAGSSSVDCVCAGSSAATATAHYPTISGASGQSACAYTASSDLPPSPTSTKHASWGRPPIPNHDEFSVQRGNSTAGSSTAGNSTSTSAGAVNANAPS